MRAAAAPAVDHEALVRARTSRRSTGAARASAAPKAGYSATRCRARCRSSCAPTTRSSSSSASAWRRCARRTARARGRLARHADRRGAALLAARAGVSAVIRQVGDVESAAECLNHVLSNNAALLDKFVDEFTVRKFVALINDRGPHKRFLHFFKAICSCQGRQIATNQELCLHLLCHDAETYHGMLLKTKFADNPGTRAPWKSLSDQRWRAQNPGRPVNHGKFLGDKMAKAGFDPVYVSWRGEDDWRPGRHVLFHRPRARHRLRQGEARDGLRDARRDARSTSRRPTGSPSRSSRGCSTCASASRRRSRRCGSTRRRRCAGRSPSRTT